MNKEFNNDLFECSFLIVSLLLKKYKQDAITLADFYKHTKHKIEYLQNNLKYINDSTQKSDIENMINECININNIAK